MAENNYMYSLNKLYGDWQLTFSSKKNFLGQDSFLHEWICEQIKFEAIQSTLYSCDYNAFEKSHYLESILVWWHHRFTFFFFSIMTF